MQALPTFFKVFTGKSRQLYQLLRLISPRQEDKWSTPINPCQPVYRSPHTLLRENTLHSFNYYEIWSNLACKKYIFSGQSLLLPSETQTKFVWAANSQWGQRTKRGSHMGNIRNAHTAHLQHTNPQRTGRTTSFFLKLICFFFKPMANGSKIWGFCNHKVDFFFPSKFREKRD